MSLPSSSTLLTALPPDAQKLLLVLLLSFLIGLEREEHKEQTPPGYSFGGVRTFPLIGLLGYALAMASRNNPIVLAMGLAVIGAFMLLSFYHKLSSNKKAGLTSEVSGLFIYVVGALVFAEHFWVATALVVSAVLLLELKTALEGLATRLPSGEILTFTKFMLLSAVILPVLPDEQYTAFHINPFRTWLVVVAISGISYGSYLLQKLLGRNSGILMSAALGGAYSSTVTTIALAKRSKDQNRPHLFAGAILAASGVMYFRLGLLLTIFSQELRSRIGVFLFTLAVAAIAAGFLLSRISDGKNSKALEEVQPRNPLELSAAFFFAFLFVAMLVVTGFALTHLGSLGVYTLALITGVTDVDPFIMGLTQAAGTTTSATTAAIGILVAAASNNVVKGIYAFVFSPGATGRQSLVLLSLLAMLGLTPLLLLTR
ncbi:MAG: MgtC/SapB family protein [Deltaproteobacteria bacterium]|nr:MgtC/SapB family protein [Deltaproteobacteria bacterium]